jgi:hypothetical protein
MSLDCIVGNLGNGFEQRSIIFGWHGSIDESLAIQKGIQCLEFIVTGEVDAFKLLSRTNGIFDHASIGRVSLGRIFLDERHLIVCGLHRGEQQDFLNVVLVGQEHGKAVNAKTEATGWRETMFQSGHKGIIQNHGFVVSCATGLGLIHKQLVLDHGIVQLGVGIGQLDTQIETVNKDKQSFI